MNSKGIEGQDKLERTRTSHKYAIIDEQEMVCVAAYHTRNEAEHALLFWNRNTCRHAIYPIDGIEWRKPNDLIHNS